MPSSFWCDIPIMKTLPLSLLSVPIEIRYHVYKFLFENLWITPYRTNDGVEDDKARIKSVKPNKVTSLAILQTCHQCYTEAYEIFWNTAIFQIKNLSQHDLFTTPPLFTYLCNIRYLAVDSDLLDKWTTTNLRAITPNLTSFTILSIPAGLRHTDMVRLQRTSNLIDGDGGSDYSAIDVAPSLVLFRALIVAMDEKRQNQIMDHFNACHGSHTLRLDFKITCLHIGQVVVPGQWPMADRTHEHEPYRVAYSFNT